MVEEVLQEPEDIRVLADGTFQNDFFSVNSRLGLLELTHLYPASLPAKGTGTCSTLQSRGILYRRAIFLPFVDHLMQLMSIRLGPLYSRKQQHFALVLSITGERENSNTKTTRQHATNKIHYSRQLVIARVVNTLAANITRRMHYVSYRVTLCQCVP